MLRRATVKVSSRRHSSSGTIRYYRFESDHRKTEAEIVRIKQDVARVLESQSREDPHVYSTLLLKCGSYKLVEEGELLHGKIEALWESQLERLQLNCLVEMYGKCGRLDKAKLVFASIRCPNVFSWAIVIAANAQNGHCKEALELFRRMECEGVRANKVTYVNVIGACSELAECRRIHARVVGAGFGNNVVVITALLTVFGKLGGLEDARAIFERIPEKDVVAWNALITAYAQQGHCEECLQLYHEMVLDEHLRPDEVTYVSVIDACAGLKDLEQGRRIHARVIEERLEFDTLMSALVDMYGKCGSAEDAKRVFDKMKWRETSTWNALISAFSQHGDTPGICKLLQEMDLEGMKTTDITFISLLQSFSTNCSFRAARSLHSRISAVGFEANVWVATSLVNMYGRCGLVDEAREVFDGMPVRNMVSFNAMIGAYAEVCRVEQVLEVLWMMDQDGVAPDLVTLLIVLFSCSHSGLVEEGVMNFRSMSVDRGLRAGADHYRCMVDLLARAGWICEAEEVLEGSFQGLDDLPSITSLLAASLR